MGFKAYILKLFFVLYGLSIYAQTISVEYYNKISEKDDSKVKSLISSNDSWSLYQLAPYLDSYNQMYLATSDKIYIKKAVYLINSVIEKATPSYNFRKSQFRDKYKGWTNRSHPEKGNDGKEYPLYESYFWRYVTYTLYLIKSNELAEFEKDFLNALQFTQNHVFNKWNNRGNYNIYRENTNMASLWASISLNLWRITGDDKYSVVFKKFIKNFEDNIINRSNGSIFWNSFFNKMKWDKKGQDVLHANAEVGFFVEAYIAGVVQFELIEKLISTLNHTILRKDLSTAMYLNGSGESKGRIVDGFMKLGRFDRRLQNRLLQLRYYQPSEFHRESQFVAVLLANNKILNSKL